MAENRYKRAEKVFPISLGAGDRAFESHYSDQNPAEIVDFSGLFLFLVYCGAKGECIYILSFKATLDKIYITYTF